MVSGQRSRLESHRYVGLLFALIALLLLSAVLEEVQAGDFPLAVVFTLLLVFTVNAASDRRRHLLIAVSLGVPWVLMRWAAFLLEIPVIETLAGIILVALLFFTIGIVIAHVMSVSESDFNFLCGGIAVYFLVGVTWALSYRLIDTFVEGSFAIAGADAEIPWQQFLYFSFTTLTTLGYGDITPLKPVARMWSTLEAATGVLYTAVLVARLVAIFRR